MKKLPLDRSSLVSWFQKHKRSLPWREAPSPYAVWISEVMLQQTQVVVVIDYFQRWMARFPTIESLAKAELDEVIKLWEGLGYYSRARHLHQAARYLVEHHQAELPSTREELAKVVGLGPYTIGAILSFAFHKRAAAVDGNVIRVLSRYTALEEVVCLPATQKKIWGYAEEILPEEEPWVVVEALIELGATVCMRQPKCFLCPLNASCRGLKEGIADLLPKKRDKAAVTHLKREVIVICSNEHVLVRKGSRGKLMQDLYEFPYFESDPSLLVQQEVLRQWKLKIQFEKKLPQATHTFTRYKACLFPSLWIAEERIEIPDYQWISYSKLSSLPFSAGHRRILISLKEVHDEDFAY
ncbi:MAG: A/G-specific adenine glycosylase [Rhabdochlamydiaceae bacterium]|nr:A/G-specific adenine glycosylase [Rhabdochlamydiaceae bacterium]